MAVFHHSEVPRAPKIFLTLLNILYVLLLSVPGNVILSLLILIVPEFPLIDELIAELLVISRTLKILKLENILIILILFGVINYIAAESYRM